MFFSEAPDVLAQELIDMLVEKQQTRNEAEGWVPSNPYGNAKLLDEVSLNNIGNVLFEQLCRSKFSIYKSGTPINAYAQQAGVDHIKPFVPEEYQGWNFVLQYNDAACEPALNMHYQVHKQELDEWVQPLREYEEEHHQENPSVLTPKDIVNLHLYNNPQAWNEWQKETVFGSGNANPVKVDVMTTIAQFKHPDDTTATDPSFCIPMRPENINCDMRCCFLIMPSEITYIMFNPYDTFSAVQNQTDAQETGAIAVVVPASDGRLMPLDEEKFVQSLIDRM